MRSKSLLAVLATVMIVASVIAPVLLIGGTAKAQGTIVLSSPNLNPYKALELDIRLPGVDVSSVTLRLYKDGAFIADFPAGKLATGRYIAYLIGHYALDPANPKVSLTYSYRLTTTVDPTKEATLTVEVLGYDVAIDIPFKPVAAALTLDRTKIPSRSELWGLYEVTLSISDQDLNYDPTNIDDLDFSKLYMYVKLIKKETTGETFGGEVPAAAFAGLSAKETSANSGVFKLTLTPSDILDLIEAADGSFTGNKKKFDKGDLLIMEVASDIPLGDDYKLSDSKNIDIVYTYPEVSVDFTNQAVKITINSPDDNVKTGVKNNLARDVAVTVYEDGVTAWSGLISGSKFAETGANTGIFTYTLSVKWDTTTAIDVTNNIIKIKTGKSSFEVKATYLDISTSKKYSPVEPAISVERATAKRVVLNVDDQDLNNDATELESLTAELNTATGEISFKKGGVTLYKVTIMDSAGTVLLKGAGITYSPSFFETGLNSNIFQVSLPATYTQAGADKVLFEAGKSYIIKLVDYTGPEYMKTLTVTIAEIKVELDRNVYPINLDKDIKVHVTLYDDRLNEKPTEIDSKPSGVLKYYIYNPTTGKYITATGALSDTKVEYDVGEVKETGPNTGVFTATITISKSAMKPAWIGAKITVYRVGEPDFKAEGRFDVYQVSPGDLSVDKTLVPINGTIVVTVYDPDANVDSKAEDEVSVKVYVDGVEKPVTWKLKETGANTGKFTCAVSPAKDIPDVEPASTIKFEYEDKTPIRDPTAAEFGTPIKVSVTIKVASYTGTLVTPKDWIGPYEIMVISVKDPDLNLNTMVAEDASVKITLEGTAETKTLTLKETGVNTGVFEGKFSLGWWERGDVEYTIPAEEIREKEYIGKRITMVYEDEVDETGSRKINVATLTIRAVDAEVLTDKDAVNLGETLVITVKNLDIAGNPKAEFRRIIVRSTTYPVGITFYVTEVESGIYQVKVTPVSLKDWVMGAPEIPAKLGDTLTIEYVDPIAADGTKKLFSKTVIVGVPIERPVPASAVKFADPITGVVKTAGKVGEMILIQADVKNVDVVERPCTIVIKVKDAAGVTIHIGTATATLASGQVFTSGVTWVPTLAGDYTIEVLVVKSLAEPTPYSDKITAPLTVTA
ncbi:MAG: hypothetical protein QXX99_06125 [Candidatus Bathyarchaeia archaeon]